jgi:hypothetical protein
MTDLQFTTALTNQPIEQTRIPGEDYVFALRAVTGSEVLTKILTC